MNSKCQSKKIINNSVVYRVRLRSRSVTLWWSALNGGSEVAPSELSGDLLKIWKAIFRNSSLVIGADHIRANLCSNGGSEVALSELRGDLLNFLDKKMSIPIMP